jgi:hypothetical protein
LNQVNTPTRNKQISRVAPSFEVYRTSLENSSSGGTHIIEMSLVVTSPQLNQVNTPTANNEISPILLSFEVFRTPLAGFPSCGTEIIELFWVVNSPQLNQVNTPTLNKKIDPSVWVLSIKIWSPVMLLNLSKMTNSTHLASIISQYLWEVL